MKKPLIILSAVLTLLSAAFLGYVADTLVRYENNQLDNYMARFILNLKDKDYAIPLTETEKTTPGAYDRPGASLRNGLAYLAEKDTLGFRLLPGTDATENPTFDVYDGNNPLVRVTLYAKARNRRLGLFTFNTWDVKEVVPLKAGGLYDYQITVPNNCTVEINGRRLDESQSADSVQNVGLSDISRKTGFAYPVRYLIRGLTDAPDVKVTDASGQAVECEATGTRLSKPLPCLQAADEATARTKIKDFPDILSIVHEWSLYMSHDQHGGNQGFDNVRKYLVAGTYLYIYAQRWSTSIDITYVSNHGLAKERFTDEKVSNFKIYSDKDFECDVRLQKNLVVHHPLPEKLAERIHFLYYDDTDDGQANPSWKILSMKSLPRM